MRKNKMNKKILAFVIAICLALPLLAGIPRVKAAGGTTLSLQPSAVTGPSPSIELGKTFNLTLNVANVTNLWSWKVMISWNPAILNLTTWSPTAGSFLSGLFIATPTSYTGGNIKEMSDTLLTATGVSGSGVLATLGFTILAYTATPSVIGISNAVMLDPSTPHNNIPFTVQNATFTLPPPPATPSQEAVMALSPSVYTAQQVGETFTINITVSNVQNLWSWKAEVTWDPTVLKLTGSPSEGPFLKNIGSTLFLSTPPNMGTIKEISSTLLSLAGASGSGVLATLNFTINKQTVASPITLNSTVFLAPLNTTTSTHPNIDHQVQNATVILTLKQTNSNKQSTPLVEVIAVVIIIVAIIGSAVWLMRRKK